ncbi:MAG: hypothetical protein QOF60_822 [Actinomycetota bacterium]|jgi:predicted anti-sigma-YlaC factor YlaD|nr:hypothetical protein [Actinomycetota bacterium]
MIDCDRAREAAPELALDVLDGEERARVLAHVESCPSCRRELRDLTATVDALLGLAPPVASPVMRMARPRRTRRWVAGAAVAAAFAILLGVVVVDATSHRPATRVALVSPSGAPVGYVVVGESHLETWVERPVDATEVGCRFTMADGRVFVVASFTLHRGTGWWKVDRPEAEVRTLELVDGDQVVAIARFA